jgi:hypothetical protein
LLGFAELDDELESLELELELDSLDLLAARESLR